MSRRYRRTTPPDIDTTADLPPEHPPGGPEQAPGDENTPPRPCGTCDRDLTAYEPATCHRCIDRARTFIGDIVELYGQLPDHIGHLTGLHTGSVKEKHPTPPLPGGDALVLLAAGSYGWNDTADTTRDDDPPSVAQTFTAWEDRWRRRRHEPAATTTATVTTTTGYVLGHLQWAANTDPAFPTLTEELRHLRTRMRVVTGTISPPVKSDAHCLAGDCGGRLEQRWRDDGLDDTRICPDCRATYNPAQYRLAFKAHLQEQEDNPLMTAALIVATSKARFGHQVTYMHIARWVKNNKLTPQSHVRKGKRTLPLYRVVDVLDLLVDPHAARQQAG